MGFRHKGLRRLYEDDDARGVGAEISAKACRILARLEVSRQPGDMDLPGYRLHPLKGNRQGFWAVRITGNWRILFRFEGQNVTDVDLLDYH